MSESGAVPTPVGRLALLGGATLQLEGRPPLQLERKTAGLLAYLALCGPTPRSTLAGLLWPEAEEGRARSNLRQCLHRLRRAAGADVVAPEEPLRLAAGVLADAPSLEVWMFERQYAEAARPTGALLHGHDYDDCPNLADWLLAERERLAGLRREALRLESERLEAAGELRGALDTAERWLASEPVSEEAWRRVMRLHYLRGDRPAALAAYARCEATLARELGVGPLAATRELRRQIERGQDLGEGASAPPELPLSVLRPPVLVGRESEWAAMAAAWAQGLSLLLVGEPGAGKTRLLQDFLQAHGPYVLHQGRPGDADVPYSVFARGLRAAFSRFPGLGDGLPAWVRGELARLLPELGGPPPAPIAAGEQKLRFFEALAHVQGAVVAQGVRCIGVDDLQYFDSATIEALDYLAARLGEEGGVRILSAYRAGELAPAHQVRIEQAVEAGLATRLAVRPLGPEALDQLLESLGWPEVAGLGAALGRATGGNPLFVLETLKSLWESGGLRGGRPERLPVPGQVGALIARRLERLSPPALNLARVAAVAGGDFGPELAAATLHSDPLTLAQPWSELEAAQILRGRAFTHDLLAETARGGLPLPIKTHLHRRVAEVLEVQQADPARVASHWLEAGDSLRAAPRLLEAARRADAASLTSEALRFARQAAEVYRAAAQPRLEHEALWMLGTVAQVGLLPVLTEVVGRMQALAERPLEVARTAVLRSLVLEREGHFEAALSAARAGAESAAEAGDLHCQAELRQFEADSCVRLGRWDEAARAQRAFRQLAERWGDPEAVIAALFTEGRLQAWLGRHREALGRYAEGMGRLTAWGQMLQTQAQLWGLTARSYLALGELAAARGALARAAGVVATFEVSPFHQTRIGFARCLLHQHEADYGQALAALEEARGQHDAAAWRDGGPETEAGLLSALGQSARAVAVIGAGLEAPGLDEPSRTALLILLLRLTGRADLGAAIAPRLPRMPGPQARIDYGLAQARWADPARALALARAALDAARAAELGPLAAEAELACAEALLGLGQPGAARAHAGRAAAGSAQQPHLRLLALWAQARAGPEAEAPTPLREAAALLAWMADRVPANLCPDFLAQPNHRAILGAATAADSARPPPVTPQ